MKIKRLIWLLLLIVSPELTFGQTIIHSTCLNDTSILYPDVMEFSYEIALSEMRDENHYYHDSIIVPQLFLDSIVNYVSAFHNATYLSDSVLDYRDFYSYNLEFGELIMELDSSINCVDNQNGKLVITNDTLSNYIDSLKLYPQIWNDNILSLTDTNSMINIYGDFNFFKAISCVKDIDIVFLAVDILPCYKSRFGDFQGDKLKITLSDVNYCDNNDYSYNWIYTVNNDCQIEINNFPTSIDMIINLNIGVYPNPFDDKLCFETGADLVSIRLLGLDGKTYLQSDIRDAEMLHTSGLRKGLYLVEIKTKKGFTYRKMIKK